MLLIFTRPGRSLLAEPCTSGDDLGSEKTSNTAVSSEAWAKLREWAILTGKGRLLLSGSVVLASLKAAVQGNLFEIFGKILGFDL